MSEELENGIALAIVWVFFALCAVSAFIASAVLVRALSPIFHNLSVAWKTLAGIGG